MKVIYSMEVAGTCDQFNVLELDEHSEELQNVFVNISAVRVNREDLQVSRQVELNFMSLLNVCRKRPRK